MLDQSPRRRRRPFGVTVIALVSLTQAALTVGVLTAALVAVLLAGAPLDETTRQNLDDSIPALLLLLPFACLGLVSALGLWRLRRWGWVGVMVSAGASLTVEIGAYLAGEPTYFTMLLSVITVFYLNQRDVQAAFESGGRAPAEPVT